MLDKELASGVALSHRACAFLLRLSLMGGRLKFEKQYLRVGKSVTSGWELEMRRRRFHPPDRFAASTDRRSSG